MSRNPRLTTIRAPRRSSGATRSPTGDAAAAVIQKFAHTFEQVLDLPAAPSSRWHRAGVGRRTERLLNAAFATILVTFAAGWTWSIAEARASEGPLGATTTPGTSAIGAALTDPDAPTIAYLTDATVQLFTPLRGESGRLRAVVGKSGQPIVQDSLPAGATITYSTAGPDSGQADPARTTAALGTPPDSLADDSTRVPLAPE